MERLNLQKGTYFITSVTHKRKDFFRNPEFAEILQSQLLHYEENYNYNLIAYAILPDHYHALIKLSEENQISRILYAIHSYSSKLINESLDRKHSGKIWQGNAFDEVIKSENMYYQKLAYILFNPWKENLVDNPLDNYKFSNIDEVLEEQGEEYVQDLFRKYSRWNE